MNIFTPDIQETEIPDTNIPLNEGEIYKQDLQIEPSIYDSPIILIYILIDSENQTIFVRINDIVLSNNGIEINLTEGVLFNEGILKPNQKILVSATTVYPGTIDYIKITLTYSINDGTIYEYKSVEVIEAFNVSYRDIYEIIIPIKIR
ncbi:TPA: hypothetical protein EYP83_01880 [Candidatus Geothermarchaeota archaeon]|nr:hypothetical protein [Candidatus Geothermarchaeota archaeon]